MLYSQTNVIVITNTATQDTLAPSRVKCLNKLYPYKDRVLSIYTNKTTRNI